MTLSKSKLLNNFTNLTHAFTSRDDGNLAFHVDDNPLDVKKNHKHLATKLDYDLKALVHMKQIHSNIIHIMDENDNFENPPTCDALITNKIDTPIMVMVADCIPILLYDDKQKVIAVAHAGRAGAFKNIVQNVINSFIDDFKSDVKNINVAIGTSIGPCCYEVGSEIDQEAKKLNLDYAIAKKEDRYFLDVQSIIKTQLLGCSIKKENIEISNECSCCNNDKYFSYRAEGTTGRFCGVISL